MTSNHYNKFIDIAVNQAINNKSSVTSKHCAVLVKNGKYKKKTFRLFKKEKY